MRRDVSDPDSGIASILGFAAAAAFLVCIVLLGPDVAFAGEPKSQAGSQASPPCNCADQSGRTSPAVSPDAPTDIRGSLDHYDQLAVIQAMHLALTEIGDGASYVWHRSHGRLSGIVQINGTYKSGGNLCRRMTVMLTAGTETRRISTTACRLADRSWQIVGS